jgi:hypothetical protein
MQSSPPLAGRAREASDLAALPVAAGAIADPLVIRIRALGDEVEPTVAAAHRVANLADSAADAADNAALLSKNQQKKELRRARFAQLHASKKALKKAQIAELKAAKMEEVRSTIRAMTADERGAWEAVREGRRAERREAAAAKRERLRRALEGEGEESGGQGGGGGGSSSPPTLKVIVDCGFPDGMMAPSEARSLAGQLARCVGSNARAARPARLAFAGVAPPLSPPAAAAAPPAPSSSSPSTTATARLLSEGLSKIDGRERWPVRWLRSLEEEVASAAAAAADDDAAPSADAARSPLPPNQTDESNREKKKKKKNRMIYLSADADQELSALLDPEATLVIGGLVDRNRHRGAARSRALSMGMETARLPLQTLGGAVLSSSAVLTVDQTFALLLAAVDAGSGSGDGGQGKEEGEQKGEEEETQAKARKKVIRADWAAGVRAAVPTRKLARARPRGQEHQQEASGAPEA